MVCLGGFPAGRLKRPLLAHRFQMSTDVPIRGEIYLSATPVSPKVHLRRDLGLFSIWPEIRLPALRPLIRLAVPHREKEE